jgi:hypothetical protein
MSLTLGCPKSSKPYLKAYPFHTPFWCYTILCVPFTLFETKGKAWSLVLGSRLFSISFAIISNLVCIDDVGSMLEIVPSACDTSRGGSMVKLLHVCYKKALYSSNLLVTSFQDYKARKKCCFFLHSLFAKPFYHIHCNMKIFGLLPQHEHSGGWAIPEAFWPERNSTHHTGCIICEQKILFHCIPFQPLTAMVSYAPTIHMHPSA